MTVEDLRNDPSRRPNPMAVSWGRPDSEGNATGVTKHFQLGGPEDESGRVDISHIPAGPNGGRYEFTAMHYNPYYRDKDPDAGWTQKEGEFVVKTPFRAMRAGEALLKRIQTSPYEGY